MSQYTFTHLPSSCIDCRNMSNVYNIRYLYMFGFVHYCNIAVSFFVFVVNTSYPSISFNALKLFSQAIKKTHPPKRWKYFGMVLLLWILNSISFSWHSIIVACLGCQTQLKFLICFRCRLYHTSTMCVCVCRGVDVVVRLRYGGKGPVVIIVLTVWVKTVWFYVLFNSPLDQSIQLFK